ncbi:hypothetical protein [Schinkia azotoformans]|uniref:hypothetical protein n=1 Tax=Schinkia azotoformans TaxID=1454 RepID=UPI002DBF9B06|nr:hypothetical protein [Schinkia azotoformans]MEC1772311.1 hypothetical protein [Schinkia azotoformans]MED4367054.1 hypothetical protein [Schinkia azotoformans]
MKKTFSPEDYDYTETEDETIFEAKKPNKDGFIVNVSFTKDKDEHKESMDAIKEFFMKEIL